MSYFDNRADDEYITVADLRHILTTFNDEVQEKNRQNDRIVNLLRKLLSPKGKSF